ncbi:MAG TPA: DUF1343 domain-containing protein, partial [Microlunatus sp.]
TGVLADLTPTARGLLDAGVRLKALFGPEHGLRGSAQAGGSESHDVDPDTGLPVHDTYLMSGGLLAELLDRSGVDVVIVDLQDIGARFYTYLWSLYDLMVAAARTGRQVIILDRPNPIGGLRAGGPSLDRSYASFVGRVPMPVRHGLTLGELAGVLNEHEVPNAAGKPADLSVLTMDGWQRRQTFDQTGLIWVPPSPNIPTVDTAISYVGSCLFEGTNVSEGRGTTHPFEIIGAPWIDGRLAAAPHDRRPHGVIARDLSFVPTFAKYAGIGCRGIQLHVVDRERYRPIETTLMIMEELAALYPEFGLRDLGSGVDNPGEGYALDRLWGSDALRLLISGRAVGERVDLLALLSDQPDSPAAWAGDRALLYP